MSKTILITGGTGLVGTRLTEMLLEKGYQVSILVREKKEISKEKKEILKVRTYFWDIKNKSIEPEALQNADAIIHLAGAGIADERWTDDRKKEILDSRTDSAKLLFEKAKSLNLSNKIFVSASAIGIYSADSGSAVMHEDSPKGNDFLAEVCIEWEKSIEPFQEIGWRTVMLRIGVVLSDKGGALPKLVQPIKLGAGAALGSGKQIMSWIHIDDLCRMFIYALENQEITGAYNAVAPNPVSNKTLTHQAAKILGKWVLPFNVPEFGLRLAFGEMTDAILSNNTVSCEKITKAGFQYLFSESEKALADLLS